MVSRHPNPPPIYLLDTQIVLHYVRGNALGKKIESDYQLRKSPFRPLICVVSVAEALGLAYNWNWGEKKRKTLTNILGEFVRVDIDNHFILNAYAELYAYSRKHGLSTESNDLWIAACSKVTDTVLLTLDKDFDGLAEANLNQREWICSDSGEPSGS